MYVYVCMCMFVRIHMYARARKREGAGDGGRERQIGYELNTHEKSSGTVSYVQTVFHQRKRLSTMDAGLFQISNSVFYIAVW